MNRPPSEPLNTVYAAWNVPSVAPPPSAWNGNGYNDGTYRCSVWVGLDGTSGTSDVLQAGVACIVVVAGGVVSSTSYYAWTEWYGLPEAQVSNFPVSPGDQVSCTVCAPFGNTHGTASFLNLTTQAATSVGIDPPAQVTLSGNVAEWIVEDPGIQGGGQFPFPNYGAVVFRNCVAGSKDIELNLTSATPLTLVEGGNTLSTASIENVSTLVCYYGK